jgi:glutamate dehydrogenase
MTHRLVAEAKKLLPAKSAAALKEFAEEFFSKVPKDDIDILEPRHIASIAEKHWQMAHARKKGKSALEIRTTNLKKGDADIGYTLIDIVNDDMAFLVDSVAAEIARHNRTVHLLVHPVLHAKFDAKGGMISISATPDDKRMPQSHMHIQIQGAMAESMIPVLEKDLRRVLDDVRFATRDWLQMREKLRDAQKILAAAPPDYGREEVEEYIHFLDYLYKDNFTLLGYREYKFTTDGGKVKSQVVKGASLGLLHDDIDPVYLNGNDNGLPQELQKLRLELPPLTVAKVNKRSTVHRSVPLDSVTIKKYDAEGKVTGEILFIGLFTSVTYSRSIQDVPLLRRKAETVMTRSGFRTGGHNYKALRHILEKYPRDELFQIPIDDLVKTALSIMTLQERQRIALYTRRDPFRRYVSCLVYVPRDRYDTRLRTTIQSILEEEIHGRCEDFYTNLDDSAMARIMFMIYTDQNDPPHFNRKRIETKLQEAGRAWSEKLAMALLETLDDESAIPEIVEEYGNAFSVGYQQDYTAKQSVYDIGKMKEPLAANRIALDLYRCKGCFGDELRLKIYSRDVSVILSDILPILENMGLTVVSERPYEVRAKSAPHAVWIQDFLMESRDKTALSDIDEAKPKFEEALLKTWYGEMENDSLNHLILRANMDWRDIMILRTYVRYMRQARTSFSTRFIERALYSHPAISRNMVALFRDLHDPKGVKKSNAAKISAAIEKGLESVTSLDEDRVLRTMLNLVNVTLRTNFFQPDAEGKLKSYLSVKLDSKAVADLPNPRPYREIFVYSPRMEGIHLRADVIARGGIRWSDRHEDFRTEVLGLMKAQQVKNSLIVPMGAKGGFIVKKPPAGGDRKAFLAEGIECYKILVRGLLDITDNRKGAKVVPPKNVVRRDGDDPYLVVAADKGTASFSDIANNLSAEYGFWLGDAFASGGSVGYDHKKMGITAKGAWESVKRHFRELGHDTQKSAFDVVGVGDMGGDVFGNGMLLSEHIRLIGAFNHAHIFCDPDPDEFISFKERERLFHAVAGWDAYDTKKFSKGGRIYLRSEKSLQLTPEIRARFDLDKERVAPAELIQAMLRARADLIYFGGIGTYVKASTETHADVGDKGNDALRIDASELRAKVIGEGANLAMTQASRIEFADLGGKLNADFIDNSGGVNSSDVEVNIKILMTDVMSRPKHKMTLASRNKLLASMTDEVARLVLANNYQQSQALSLMELQAPKNLTIHARFINDLDRKHGISRALEKFPDEETIDERRRAGKGLLRPELCSLQAHAKILFAKDMLVSDIPDLPEMEDHWLVNYFPRPLRERFGEEIRQHRLRREIIATTLATSMVNRMGPTFVKETMDKTGGSAADVARAFLVVREAFGLRALWLQIEALDGKVPAQVQLQAMADIGRMAARETVWFLTRFGRKPDIARDTPAFSGHVQKLRAALSDVVPQGLFTSIEQRTQAGMGDGLPRELARQIALIPIMGDAADIILISRNHKADLALAARVYFELGEQFHMDWLRQQARYITTDDRWSGEALSGLVDQLYSCQAGLTVRILRDMKGKAHGSKSGIVRAWLEQHALQVNQFENLFGELRRSGTPDLSRLIIAEQNLRQLYGG